MRNLLLIAAALSGLTGCGAISKNETPSADAALASADPEATGSIAADPKDDLSAGKLHFRQGRFDLAERHFRKATEQNPNSAEAWAGLAAAYDRLERFDRADRAYDQAIKVVGPTPGLLNNRGYSYMLRGDLRRARETLTAAAARDPQNPYVQNNLRLLADASRKAKVGE